MRLKIAGFGLLDPRRGLVRKGFESWRFGNGVVVGALPTSMVNLPLGGRAGVGAIPIRE